MGSKKARSKQADGHYRDTELSWQTAHVTMYAHRRIVMLDKLYTGAIYLRLHQFTAYR